MALLPSRVRPLVLGVCGLVATVACGVSRPPGPPAPTTINVSLSDRATCVGPAGPFSHVFITVKDVQASAGGGAGFMDLTPSLAQKPVQIDLMGAGNGQCLLASLGSTTAVPAGSFEQFRLVLEDNRSAALVANNACSAVGAANCVVQTVGGTFPIQILGESQPGILIPAGQIAGGKFVVSAGVTQDLNLDFNACASLVTVASGQFRLKPAVQAGAVALQTSVIRGTVVDKLTDAPVVGGHVMVALEQKDVTGIDRVVTAVNADSAGHFAFCPVATGAYDVVAAAVNGADLGYAATVTEGVPSAADMGMVPVIPEVTAVTTPGTISATVNTSTGTAPAPADVTISALQEAGSGSTPLTFTMPLVEQFTAPASVATTAINNCAPTAACARFTLLLPAAPATTGTFVPGGGTVYVAGAGSPGDGSGIYMLEADVAAPLSGGVPDCTPPKATTGALTLAPGANENGGAIFFTGCR